MSCILESFKPEVLFGLPATTLQIPGTGFISFFCKKNGETFAALGSPPNRKKSEYPTYAKSVRMGRANPAPFSRGEHVSGLSFQNVFLLCSVGDTLWN